MGVVFPLTCLAFPSSIFVPSLLYLALISFRLLAVSFRRACVTRTRNRSFCVHRNTLRRRVDFEPDIPFTAALIFLCLEVSLLPDFRFARSDCIHPTFLLSFPFSVSLLTSLVWLPCLRGFFALSVTTTHQHTLGSLGARESSLPTQTLR